MPSASHLAPGRCSRMVAMAVPSIPRPTAPKSSAMSTSEDRGRVRRRLRRQHLVTFSRGLACGKLGVHIGRGEGLSDFNYKGKLVNTNLSLVIPAFNEGNRLASGLQRLMESISPDDTEIIVVDDGSSDDTAELARRQLKDWSRSSVVSLPQNRGKGAAVKAGVIRRGGASSRLSTQIWQPIPAISITCCVRSNTAMSLSGLERMKRRW